MAIIKAKYEANYQNSIEENSNSDSNSSQSVEDVASLDTKTKINDKMTIL